MSVQAMTAVMERAQARGTARLVLLLIANHETEDKGAFPSIERIAHEAGMSERNIIRIVANLEASGELSVQRGQGPRGTHLYRTTPKGGDALSGDTSGPEMSPKRKELGVSSLVPQASVGSDLSVTTRKPDLLVDALFRACGIDYSLTSRSERRACGVAAADIRAVWGDMPGEFEDVYAEVERRALNYGSQYPEATLTPNALSRHWGISANARRSNREGQGARLLREAAALAMEGR